MKFVRLLFTLAFFALPAQAKYGGGTGEPNDPYLIYTAKQMNAIGADSNDWDKHFRLMADIGLRSYVGTFNIIGYYRTWNDNTPFAGVFDGNGKTISDFSYHSSIGGCVGLFGYVAGENAQIKDLRLVDPNVGGGDDLGALVGVLDVGGAIHECYVERASLRDGSDSVGGLVGSNSGTITDCHTAGRVCPGRHDSGGLAGENGGIIINCSSSVSVSGGRWCGGLVGPNFGAISRCYCTGAVSDGQCCGGLVGANYGVISECFSTSSVLGETISGGLVGQNTWLATLLDCYASGSVAGGGQVGGLVGSNYGTVAGSFWDTESSSQTASDGGTGKTTAEMKQKITFANWNFVEVWDLAESQTYPFLRWHPVGDLNYDYHVDLLDLAILTEHWLEGVE